MRVVFDYHPALRLRAAFFTLQAFQGLPHLAQFLFELLDAVITRITITRGTSAVESATTCGSAFTSSATFPTATGFSATRSTGFATAITFATSTGADSPGGSTSAVRRFPQLAVVGGKLVVIDDTITVGIEHFEESFTHPFGDIFFANLAGVLLVEVTEEGISGGGAAWSARATTAEASAKAAA